MIENNKNQPEELITPKNILLKIWLSPKESFKFIDNYKYDKHVILLLILSGIVQAFDKAISKNMGDDFSIWGVIIFSILIGTTCGWIINYLYATTISLTGKWFNAKGDTRSILRVIAYALTPSIISLILLLVRISIYGNAVFQSPDNYFNGQFDEIIYYLFYFIELILVIWTMVLFAIGVSVAQKISIGKAILNIILPAFLIILSALTLFVISDLLLN
ncbi:Yip1 family protein [Flavobacterium branchiarum]|uniref:Yip1 family protein n=1 Tax=Flavobacterium branchiarum TaxID=1114870 RepID=A0ABV5FKE2_9FLAO|nr:Yip1 family protein [Flavobacterium branchiarum]MDN3672280.1 Yip1 family protein [Flavobacterium branchiarum]